jgi:hypothetical protein
MDHRASPDCSQHNSDNDSIVADDSVEIGNFFDDNDNVLGDVGEIWNCGNLQL